MRTAVVNLAEKFPGTDFRAWTFGEFKEKAVPVVRAAFPGQVVSLRPHEPSDGPEVKGLVWVELAETELELERAKAGVRVRGRYSPEELVP